MSFKGRFLSVLTLAVALTAFGTISFAQEAAPQKDGVQKGERGMRKYGKGGREGFRGGRGGFGMLRGIELTDAQKQQIKTIMESNRGNDSARTEIRTLVEARRNGALSDDQKARLKELRQQSQEKARIVREQILAVLTPEQKVQLEQRRQQMQERRQQRRQMRQDRQTTDSPTDN